MFVDIGGSRGKQGYWDVWRSSCQVFLRYGILVGGFGGTFVMVDDN